MKSIGSRIADFGLARAAVDNIELTARELAVGTPAYMSPEQVAGEQVDARSDLFALGCVINAMLTGHSPFHGRNALEIARKVEAYEPPQLERCGSFDSQVPRRYRREIVGQRPRPPLPVGSGEVADVLNRHLAMLNLAPSDQLPHLLQTTELATDSPTKKSSGAIWLSGALSVLMVGILIAFSNPSLRTQFLGNVDKGEDVQPLAVESSADSQLSATELAATELTVSASGEADYRTLGEALSVARKATTIRVLDDATYPEAVEIGGANHEGLKLISEQHATLVAPADTEGERHTLNLNDARDVTVQGFAINSSGQGHAVFIGGSAHGVVLENLTCENTAVSGPYATVQVFISSSTSDGEPFRMLGCHVTNRGTSPCVWLHEPAHDVVITKSHFSCTETGISLWDSSQRLEITHNIFMNGQDGVSLVIMKWPDGCHLQISNNTFLSSRVWLTFAGDSVAGGNVEVVNNLILGCERIGMSRQQQTDAANAWRFHCNHWERGPVTAADAGRQGAIARVHEPGVLKVPRDPNADDFVVPSAGSELLTSGRGDIFPTFVGAKDRSD